MQVLGNHGYRVRIDKRQLPGGELIHHHAQGIQVRARIDLLPKSLLRCQVENCTSHSPIHRVPRSYRPGQPEIHQLGCAVIRNDHIFRFQVAVNNALCVGVLQPGTHLAHDRQGIINIFWWEFMQRFSPDIFHHDERHAICLAYIVHRDDVGMVEFGCYLCFAE